MATSNTSNFTTAKKELTVILPLILNKQVLAKKLADIQPALPTANADLTKILFQLFNLSNLNELAAGALTALAAGLPVSQGWWLRADPVQITINSSTAYLLGNNHLYLTQAEIAALANDLKNFLQLDNYQLHLLNEREWCLELTEEPKIKTHTLTEAIGKPLQDYLPQGEAGQKWQMLLTELQMVLSTSQVNVARAAQQQPLINSLWFWGEGRLPTTSTSTQWQLVWSQNLLVQGLAKYTNTPAAELVVNFNECLKHMQSAGQYLLDLSAIPAVWLRQEAGDISAFIDLQWLNPILSAYQKDKLTKVTFFDSHGGFYQLNNQRKRAWWQKLLF